MRRHPETARAYGSHASLIDAATWRRGTSAGLQAGSKRARARLAAEARRHIPELQVGSFFFTDKVVIFYFIFLNNYSSNSKF